MPVTSTPSLDHLPKLLKDRFEQYWQGYLETCNDAQLTLLAQEEFFDSVARVWSVSDYVADHAKRNPAEIAELFESGDMLREYAQNEYVERLKPIFDALTSEEDLNIKIRQFRRREMLRIFWRDLAVWSDLRQTMKALSALADASIAGVASCLYAWQCESYGTPEVYMGMPQNLIILALGKLGGGELNLSSDVDLIFTYPTRGETQGTDRPISHEQFFTRLGQRLIQTLNATTSEGFVFRVDMRLRPFGSSGPLVQHFAAMENYYKEQGRDWERYALIKARVIGGHAAAARQLMDVVNRFVYRRYIDYPALLSLREMHAMIVAETKSRQLQGNIKLGTGGIREIEFIVQAFQLMRGGEERRLQNQRIFEMFEVLAEEHLMAPEVISQLRQAYEFLRDVEHRLQSVADRQTHQLPEDEDERERLAFAMRFSTWDLFAEQLSEHQLHVTDQFQLLVAKPQLEYEDGGSAQEQTDVVSMWLGDQQAHSDATLGLLNQLRESKTYAGLSELGQQRLNQLMPLIIKQVGKTELPEEALRRLISVVHALMARTAYMVLLAENPKTLEQLVTLCASSPWVAEQVAGSLMLLGELLGAYRLYAPMDLNSLQNTLDRWLSVIPSDQVEEQLDCLLRFKTIYMFRVAALDVLGVLPIMRVSDHLTNIACVILRAVHRIAATSQEGQSNFAIVAYGKLGGIELGYGSDLDLVFLCEDANEDDTRLAQRIIQMLSAQRGGKKLYEVDTRLRPMGESGLLVSSLNNFQHYQMEQAWTWEHQALVRARVVSGNDAMVKAFDQIRHQALSKPRDPLQLRADVSDMRQKMRDSAKIPPKGMFDLKQGVGGMADIEFVVQFGVLCWAQAHPALLTYPDNIRILEGFEQEELMSNEDVRLLSDAYRAYRAVVHRLDLQNEPLYVQEDQFKAYREAVQAIWQMLME